MFRFWNKRGFSPSFVALCRVLRSHFVGLDFGFWKSPQICSYVVAIEGVSLNFHIRPGTADIGDCRIGDDCGVRDSRRPHEMQVLLISEIIRKRLYLPCWAIDFVCEVFGRLRRRNSKGRRYFIWKGQGVSKKFADTGQLQNSFRGGAL